MFQSPRLSRLLTLATLVVWIAPQTGGWWSWGNVCGLSARQDGCCATEGLEVLSARSAESQGCCAAELATTEPVTGDDSSSGESDPCGCVCCGVFGVLPPLASGPESVPLCLPLMTAETLFFSRFDAPATPPPIS